MAASLAALAALRFAGADGVVSPLASLCDAAFAVVAADASADQLVASFGAKGMTPEELIVLLGSHTVGGWVGVYLWVLLSAVVWCGGPFGGPFVSRAVLERVMVQLQGPFSVLSASHVCSWA